MRLRPAPTAPKASDEDYAQAARAALQQGQLELAVSQIAGALAIRPQHPPHLALLDGILARHASPLRLVELSSEGAFFGLCAVRARVLARLERRAEAVSHLFRAACFRPSVPYLPWAVPWLESGRRKGAGSRALTGEKLAAALVDLVRASDSIPWDDGVVANLEAAVAIAQAFRQHKGANIELAVAVSMLLRRLDRAEAATAWLAEVDGDRPPVVCEKAAVARARGALDEAIAALEMVVDHHPDDGHAWLDLADARLDAGELANAAQAYERARALAQDERWIAAGLAYAAALRGEGSLDLPERAGRTGRRVERLRRDASAYATRLADPVDPCVGVLRSVARDMASSKDRRPLRIRLRADRPLAPSVAVVLRLLEQVHGRAVRLEEATRVVAPVDPPSEKIRASVASLAKTPFHWATWCERSEGLAAALVDDGALLSALAHPPALPDRDVDPIRWLHGCQVAIAIASAASPIAEQERFVRLERLVTQHDWTTAAAVLGLRALAERAPVLRERIVEVLETARRACGPEQVHALALAVAGGALASGSARQPYWRLRAEVRLSR
jgi:tetratricopeptide (TPR) repeat protein